MEYLLEKRMIQQVLCEFFGFVLAKELGLAQKSSHFTITEAFSSFGLILTTYQK